MEPNFYCQQKCGQVDFSIEEWNKTQQELKTLTPEQLDFVMQPVPICQAQCSDCVTIVEETRLKNKRITISKCSYCSGTGYDPYPNHDTTLRPCPECGGGN